MSGRERKVTEIGREDRTKYIRDEKTRKKR